MIKSISFEKYRSFKDRTTIHIKPITVLVGPNSGGKSSIIKLLGLLSQSFTDGKSGSLLKYEGPLVDLSGFKSISYRKRSEPVTIEISSDLFVSALGHPYQWNDGDATVRIQVSDRNEEFKFLGHNEESKVEELTLNKIEGYTGMIGAVYEDGFAQLQDLVKPHREVLRDMLSPMNLDLDEMLRESFMVRSSFYGEHRGLRFVGAARSCFEIKDIKTPDELLNEDPELPEHIRTAITSLVGSNLKMFSDTLRRHSGKEVEEGLNKCMPVLQNIASIFGYTTDAEHREILVGAVITYFDHFVERFFALGHPSEVDEIYQYWLMPTTEHTFSDIKLISPLRPSPKRFYSAEEFKLFMGIAFSGDEAIDSDLKLRSDRVSQVLNEIGISQSIKLQRHRISETLSDLYSIQMSSSDSDFSSEFTDVGFGLSQIIPILIAVDNVQVRETGSTEPKLLIVEQPEVYLHPKIQARLARTFANGLKTYNKEVQELSNERHGGAFLIETHSEHLVRGLQILIAKGELSNNDVEIYYVDKDQSGNSHAKPMPLDEKGFFSEPWPEGFFDQAYLQSIELIAGKN